MNKRIERVEIFSHNDTAVFFKFFENGGKEVIGMCRSHRIFLNGQKVQQTKYDCIDASRLYVETRLAVGASNYNRLSRTYKVCYVISRIDPVVSSCQVDIYL